MKTITLSINSSGTITGIYDDRLAGLLENGKVTIRRASHVEPTADGRWQADMGPVGGPVLPSCRLRSEALSAEVEWLQAHLF